MSKKFAMTVMAGSLMLLSRGFFAVQGDTPATNIGKHVDDFTLKDVDGKSVSLGDFRDKKAVAVIFIGTQCTISNAYLPRLAELQKEYAGRGVQVLAINANRQDGPLQVAEHARKYGIPFPVLKDADNVLADRFGARRTPEAFLLDARGTICYEGRIDDQFGIGYKRSRPTRRDLAEALDEVLAGKPVSKTTTRIAGCIIARVAPAKDQGAVTFARQVAPILQKRCQECHRPGQVGPMPLLTYEDATAWAETIREVVEERRMPPWFADPRYGKFANDRRLTPEERATVLAWLKQGCPKGDEKDLPPPRQFVAGWRIGKPDLVLSMPTEFAVPAEMPLNGIPYKEFYVDTGFKEDRWVVKAEARPGAAEVVHHIVVFLVPPGKKFFPGNPETPALAGTAPGDVALQFPPDTAKRIPAGSRFVFQMHYTPNGKAQKDRSLLGLVFSRQAPRYSVLTVPIFNAAFRIPPGADKHQVESWFTFEEDSHIIGFMPHMHLRGKDFLYEAVYLDGRTEILLSVPNFNFNWQGVYRFAEPRAMPKGSKIHCVAHFDNSAGNPNNPDPATAVFWGDQTWEEMMIGWMDYSYDGRVEREHSGSR